MKINITSFLKPALTAKLLIIQREFERQRHTLLETRENIDKWALKQAQEHFEYAPAHEAHVVAHLQLFVLGNNNNVFYNLIK